jgi:hypothetical protein
MDSNLRWIGVAFVLGLCAAYALWGGGAAPRAEQPQIRGTQPEIKAAGSTDSATSKESDDPNKKVVLPFKFDPPSVDFGNVTVDEVKTEIVNIINVTDKPVKLIDVRHSCGCMKSEILAGDIAPGKSGSIKLSFHGLPGKRAENYMVEPVTEETLPKCTFDVHAKVIQVFETDRDTLDFEHIAKGEVKTIETTVKRVDGTPFKIVAWAFNRFEHKEFGVKWSEVDGSKSSAYHVVVTVTGLKGTHINMERLNLVTDRTLASSVPIFVKLDVEGDVKCDDKRLAFTADENKVLRPLETTLRLNTPGTLEIDKIDDDQGTTIKFETQHIDPQTVKVTMHMQDDCKTHQPWGELLVKTNTPDDPVRIPYTAPRLHPIPKAR